MTLFERLEQLENNEYLYLGCKSDAGFFFVGTKAEFMRIYDNVCGMEGKRRPKNNEFVPFGLREVAEEYPHYTKVPGITILVSGKGGSYWTRAEFVKAMQEYVQGRKADTGKPGKAASTAC